MKRLTSLLLTGLILIALTPTALAAEPASPVQSLVCRFQLIHTIFPQLCISETHLAPATTSSIEDRVTDQAINQQIEQAIEEQQRLLQLGIDPTPSLTQTLVATPSIPPYSAGAGIQILNGVITNTGVVTLTAESGLDYTNSTLTNTDRGSSQSIFKKFAVADQDTVEASNNSDTLTFEAGSGISITTNADDQKIIITNTSLSSSTSNWTTSGSNVYVTGVNVGVGTSSPSEALEVNGNIKITANKSLILSANTPSTGSISRLIQLRSTSNVDRPWISHIDYDGRHVAAFGIHNVNYSDSDVHKRWELKTVASSGGSNPNEMLTRFAIDYDADLAHVLFGHVDTIGTHNDYGQRAAFIHNMKTSDGLQSYNVGQWTSELGSGDSTVMSFDAKTLANDKAATIRFFRETDTSGQRRLVVLKGDGTATETFVVDADDGYLRIFGDAETAHFGSGNNTAAYLNFQSSRTAVGYDGSFATLQAGTSKGIKLNVNNSSFGQGTVLTILSDGKVGIGDTTPDQLFTVGTNSEFQVNSAGAVTAATGITSSGAITLSSLNTAGGVVYTTNTGALQTVAGSAGQCLVSNGTSAPSWGACGTGSGSTYWTLNSSQGTLRPVNSTLDLLIGGDSTTSATLAVINGTSPETRLRNSAGNYLRLQKKSGAGISLAEVASTGEALIDLDPIVNDGTSKSSVRLFRNVNTTNTGTGFSIYAADGTSTTQSFFGAKGNSYFNANAGNFGIGTNSVNYKLDVAGNSAGYLASFFNDGNDAGRHGLRVQAGADDASGTTYYLEALDGDGQVVGYLANISGTFDAYQSSDERTKTNILNTDVDGLSIVNGLRVVDYHRRSNPDGPLITGFIAQEVLDIYPQMVAQGSDGLYGIRESALIPVLTKAVQQQQVQITALSNNIDNASLQHSFETTLQSQIEELTVLNFLTAESEFIAKGKAIFENSTLFRQTAEFLGSVRFARAPVFSSNMAGTAAIPAGARSVDITFDPAFDQPPQVSVSLEANTANSQQVLDSKPQFAIVNRSNQGFRIELQQTTPIELLFSWIALYVEQPQHNTGTPDSPAPTITPTPTVSPSPAPTSSLTPTPVASSVPATSSGNVSQ